MDFKDALKTVVDEGIAPVLKEHGVRKSGRNFWLAGDGTYGIVNVQASSFGDRDSNRFTLNLGVALTRWRDTTTGWDGERPHVHACHEQVRVGQLMPDRSDKWWTIGPRTSVERRTSELRRVTEKHVVPWLLARDSEEKVRDVWLEDWESSIDLDRLERLLEEIGPKKPLPAIRRERKRRREERDRSAAED